MLPDLAKSRGGEREGGRGNNLPVLLGSGRERMGGGMEDEQEPGKREKRREGRKKGEERGGSGKGVNGRDGKRNKGSEKKEREDESNSS